MLRILLPELVQVPKTLFPELLVPRTLLPELVPRTLLLVVQAPFLELELA